MARKSGILLCGSLYLSPSDAGPGRYALSVTQQQVLDALAKVASPRGVALTDADVLSAITVNDGKVFFSINIDAPRPGLGKASGLRLNRRCAPFPASPSR